MNCIYIGTNAKKRNHDFQSPVKRNITLKQAKEIVSQLELSNNVEFELRFNRTVSEDCVGYFYKDSDSNSIYYWIHFQPA